jgi:hypothetical protein
MKNISIITTFLLININIFAQDINIVNQIFINISKERSDSVKMLMNDSIKQILTDFIENKDAVFSDFKEIKHIGKISSKDNLVTVYSWNIPLQNSSFFNCIIEQAEDNLHYLAQKNPYKPTENQTVYSNNWYGALYYRIVPFKYHDRTLYILAGMGEYRPETRIKMLETLDFIDDKPVFGEPVFFNNKKILLSRVIFEYSRVSSMYLEYNEQKKRFEFEHLSPLKSEDGESEDFFTDMSVDGYKLDDNRWLFVEDLNVKNLKSKTKKVIKMFDFRKKY